MAWITPVEWDVPAPVGNADFGRIEGDLKYLREENKTINGTTTFTNNITQTAGVTSLLATTMNGKACVNSETFIGAEVFQINGAIRVRRTGDENLYSTISQESGALKITSVNESSSTYAQIVIQQQNNAVSRESFRITSDNRFIIGGTDNGEDLFQMAYDTDESSVFGRTKLFSSISDYATIAHVDHADTTGYAMRQHSSGEVYINAPSGSSIRFRNNNTDIMLISGTTITLSQDTTITGALTCAGITSTGALTCAGITSTGAINLTTTPTSGSWTGITTIPAGIYMVALIYGNSTSYIESGTAVMFRVSSTVVSSGGTIISDGTLKAVQGGTSTITYKKY